MANQNKHIFISGINSVEKYKTPISGRGKPKIPDRERVKHSEKLLKQFDLIWKEQDNVIKKRTAERISTREGTYISFLSSVNYDLISKSLEDQNKGIRLLNIQTIEVGDENKQIRATVYIPKGKEGHFVKKIRDYQNIEKDNKKGNPRNSSLVNSIDDISIALLESLWTDKNNLMPTDNNSKWIEVWLNMGNNENERVSSFLSVLKRIGIPYKENFIFFPERAVLLIYTNLKLLVELMMQSDDLAEFRSGQEAAGFWVNESSIEQQAWIEDLLGRINVFDSKVNVCLLDTGVNNDHPLLKPLIHDNDTLSINNEWGTFDHHRSPGHGTLMAGIIGYNSLEDVLISEKQLNHYALKVHRLVQ